MQTYVNGFLLPIRISYRPPAWLLPLIFAAHLLAIFCLYFTGISLLLRVMLLLLVSASLLARVLFSHTSCHPPCQLILNAQDQWLLAESGNEPRRLYLLKFVILAPELVILLLKDNQRGKQLFILTGNNVDADTLRRLRVRLLFPKTRSSISPSS